MQRMSPKTEKKKMLFFSYIWALGKIFTIERSIVHLEKKNSEKLIEH